MASNITEGKWKQLKGKAQQKWGKLTNDDLDRVNGRREELIGCIQERYGKNREEAEREANDFFDSAARPATKPSKPSKY